MYASGVWAREVEKGGRMSRRMRNRK